MSMCVFTRSPEITPPQTSRISCHCANDESAFASRSSSGVGCQYRGSVAFLVHILCQQLNDSVEGFSANFMGTALLLGDLPPQMLHSVAGAEFFDFIWQFGRPSSSRS
jgi:hypothetical protein